MFSYFLYITDICRSYQSLDDASRSSSAPIQTTFQSDERLDNKWYRFNGGNHSQMIARTCINSSGKCGALLTGWMPTNHFAGKEQFAFIHFHTNLPDLADKIF